MKSILSKILSKYQFLLLVIFLLTTKFSFSQNLSEPIFAGFYANCVTPISLNTFRFDFSADGPFNTTDTLILQMSDGSGSFASPTVQDTKSYSASGINFLTLTVPPEFLGGSNFKFRIFSSRFGVTSPESRPLAFYYLSFTDQPIINNNSSNLNICPAGGATLTVSNNIAPLILANTRFKWFKDNVLQSETGATLLVNTQGVYYVQVDYGADCKTLKSLDVKANIYTSGGTYVITSVRGNFVAPNVPATLSTINNSGATYQWFNQNGIIVGETNFSYSTDLPGIYYVQVNDGNCATKSNSLELKVDGSDTTPNIVETIPNIVSPNNDGENDKWNIDSTYRVAGVKVLILDSKGKVALETNPYLNDWPDTNIEFDSINPIYYYIIVPKEGDVKKGSITIVK